MPKEKNVKFIVGVQYDTPEGAHEYTEFDVWLDECDFRKGLLLGVSKFTERYPECTICSIAPI